MIINSKCKKCIMQKWKSKKIYVWDFNYKGRDKHILELLRAGILTPIDVHTFEIDRERYSELVDEDDSQQELL